jgi:hypothetical protein
VTERPAGIRLLSGLSVLVQRRNRYMVTNDGKRFLFVTPLSPSARRLQNVN